MNGHTTDPSLNYRSIAFVTIGRHKNHGGLCPRCTRMYQHPIAFPCLGYRIAVAILDQTTE